MLGDDKPAAEWSMVQLVFSDIEDDEDTLLQNPRGQRQGSSEDSGVEDEAKDNLPPQKKPVWVDEDDEDEEIVDMMNNRFQKI